MTNTKKKLSTVLFGCKENKHNVCNKIEYVWWSWKIAHLSQNVLSRKLTIK